MEIYSSWSYPLDMVLQMEIYIMPLYLLGNAGAWPRLQAMFQQRWRLLAAVLWPKSMTEISGISGKLLHVTSKQCDP